MEIYANRTRVRVLLNFLSPNIIKQYTQSFPHRQQSTTSGDQVEVCIENNDPDGPDHRDINRAFAQVRSRRRRW